MHRLDRIYAKNQPNCLTLSHVRYPFHASRVWPVFFIFLPERLSCCFDDSAAKQHREATDARGRPTIPRLLDRRGTTRLRGGVGQTYLRSAGREGFRVQWTEPDHPQRQFTTRGNLVGFVEAAYKLSEVSMPARRESRL